MMAKRYLSLICVLLICVLCNGQSINGLFREFSSENNAECVNLNPVMMAFVRPFLVSAEMRDIKVKSVQVMDLSECNPEVKQRFSEKALNVKDDMYEKIVMVNDSAESVRIYAREDRNNIKELVVLTTGDNATFVRIKGNFKVSDIGEMCNNEKAHGH